MCGIVAPLRHVNSNFLTELHICTYITQELDSMSQNIYAAHLDDYKIKIHINVKKVQLKLMKGILSKIYSLSYYHFFFQSEKFTGTKDIFNRDL